jgi:hypothetical protein
MQGKPLRSWAAVALNLSGCGQIVLTALPQGAGNRPHGRQLFRARPTTFEMRLYLSPQVTVKVTIEVGKQPITDLRMD